MPAHNAPPESGPPGGNIRGLIIVARDQPDLWHYLRRQFADHDDMRIILDRRKWERRQRIQRHEPDRRAEQRRRPLSIDTDLRHRSFLFVPLREGSVEGGRPDCG